MLTTWHHSRLSVPLACVVLLVLLGAIGLRIIDRYQVPGKFDPQNQGFCDFHNGVYFPSQAFAAGVSPYGQKYADSYPVARAIPFYSPFIFAIHLPYVGMSLGVADVVHFVVLSLQILLISHVSLRFTKFPAGWSATLWLAALLVASRTSYGTLFTGYFTFEPVLATLLALEFGDRKWWGCLGFLLACAKPTYGLPLALLMLARGQWRTVLFGGLLAVALNAAAVGWLMQSATLAELRADVEYAQTEHREDVNELPKNSWTRVDLLGVVAKWLRWAPNDLDHVFWMIPLIAVPCWVVWRLSRNQDEVGCASLSGLIAGAALIASIYHHYYDLLVLVPSILALIRPPSGRLTQIPKKQRWVAAASLAFVLFNYLTANFVLVKLNFSKPAEDVVTSTNGVVLAIYMVWICSWGVRLSRSNRS
jgi:hypothetical protein